MASTKYSDYDIDFEKNSFTGDVSVKKESNAIRQSVRNIIMTRKGEKPFNRNFGVGVHQLLFENVAGGLAVATLRSDIQEALNSFEPRVVLTDVIFDETLIDSNQLSITVEYKILNESDIAASPVDRITIALTKVR
tara:strand:- start:710 stop:1117 length:408 start_codon:yes stop_codon:yes gene_type:complete